MLGHKRRLDFINPLEKVQLHDNMTIFTYRIIKCYF